MKAFYRCHKDQHTALWPYAAFPIMSSLLDNYPLVSAVMGIFGFKGELVISINYHLGNTNSYVGRLGFAMMKINFISTISSNIDNNTAPMNYRRNQCQAQHKTIYI